MSETVQGWRARALIDCAALHHNLDVVRQLAPGCKIMAVVKSDAYGHGMQRITNEIATRVDAFAVATLQEGIDCRLANPSPLIRITVLSGLQQADALEVYQQHQLTPVAHTATHVEWLTKYRGAPLSLWLKLDTGMSRLGIAPQQVEKAIAKLRANESIKEIDLMSHFANADSEEDDFTTKQLDCFQQYTDQYAEQHSGQDSLERSIANSAAIMAHPKTHFQWVRPGIMLYGASPLLGRQATELNLKPVMQLESQLIAIKEVAAGQPIGYGGTFVASSTMRIGIVGLGYGDGYPWAIDSAAEVLIDAKRVPIVGRVAMDMLTVDLTKCETVEVGSKVVLWGDGLGVEEVANWAGTISYELLCKINARVPRIAIKNTQHELKH